MILMMLILRAASAAAEPQYILPEGWYYNDAGQIIAPKVAYYNVETGEISHYSADAYDSIWDDECMRRLQVINWGYGDVDYMEKYLRIDGDTPELGDSSMSTALLIGAAALSLAGTAYARRKARYA